MKFTFEDESYGESILDEAGKLVNGVRQDTYGHPIIDFSRTARMWSALKDIEFTPSDVAKFMIALKLSRETNLPKRDNRVDMAGYILTLNMVEEYAKNKKLRP